MKFKCTGSIVIVKLDSEASQQNISSKTELVSERWPSPQPADVWRGIGMEVDGPVSGEAALTSP